MTTREGRKNKNIKRKRNIRHGKNIRMRKRNGKKEEIKKMKKIEKALGKVRAALQQDGGDIELIGIEAGVVKVRLRGACAGCPMSQMTMVNFVVAELKKAVPEIKKVQAV